jgi:AdoMet-dependent rRNA methyltransferase SPB1
MGEGYDSMDSDEIAETRALAKRMLRKKDRTEILDATYNRYSFGDNLKDLPTWFVDDE